jgi:ubiquitin carboxyl-terminal hydrolase 14
MDTTTKTVTPGAFTQALRTIYPQFDETNPENGRHMQQDADECMSQILTTLGNKLTNLPKSGPGDPKATNLIDYLFGGEMIETMTCPEAKDEPALVQKERFRKLRCHIDLKTNYLTEGIEHGLDETIEKKSPSLGRMANYVKKSAISKLPAYLMVQFVRFFWKNDTKKKAKSLRKVIFPDKLDIQPFCEPGLKASLGAARKKLAEVREKEQGLISVIGKKAPPLPGSKLTEKKTEAKSEKKDESSSSSMEVDSLAGKDIPLPKDTSGFYEMFGVVTHQGRYAESGHYIGWVRQKDDAWLKFDDDVVSPVTTEDIKALSGGGDWHMSYLLLYRRVDDLKDKKWPDFASGASANSNNSNNSSSSNNSSQSSDSNKMT